jgi:hypothetical protein
MMMANYLEHLLAKTNWGLVINHEDHLLYVRKTDETSSIEVVKKSERQIEVSIPLKNSVVQYRTRFASEMQAYEYIEDYIYDVPTSEDNSPTTLS